MHFSKLDAFFHVASQGSHEAYELLYNEYLYRAKIKINLISDNRLKFTGFNEDFHQVLDEIFLNILNDYDSTKGSFTYFVDYVLNLRLPPKVISELQRRSRNYQVKNEDGEDMDIEDFADPYQSPITTEVAMENFKLRVSSSNKHESNKTRIVNKVIMLKYVGFNNREICECLKITDAHLRKYLEIAKKSKDNEEFKLDLK